MTVKTGGRWRAQKRVTVVTVVAVVSSPVRGRNGFPGDADTEQRTKPGRINRYDRHDRHIWRSVGFFLSCSMGWRLTGRDGRATAEATDRHE